MALSILLRGFCREVLSCVAAAFFANLWLINSFKNKCQTLKGKPKGGFAARIFRRVVIYVNCR